MSHEDTSLYLVVLVAVVAMIGLALSVASLATNESMGSMMNGGGSPMMGGGGATPRTGPGGLEWAVLVLSAAFLGTAILVLLRARSWRPGEAGTATLSSPPGPTSPPPPTPARTEAGTTSAAPAAASPVPAAAVPEPTLVRLLNEDERRMYLEIRDHGGAILQRDLVALGIFSKAKVTRVLDRLESKGIVVREAHGMTNRVRLVFKGMT